MIYKSDNVNFDFSIEINYNSDIGIYSFSEVPNNINSDIINILYEALKQKIDTEYRFVGKIDKDYILIDNAYIRKGYTWESIKYDDLVDLFKLVNNKDSIHKIINRLEY